jgi:hypothetical protein
VTKNPVKACQAISESRLWFRSGDSAGFKAKATRLACYTSRRERSCCARVGGLKISSARHGLAWHLKDGGAQKTRLDTLVRERLALGISRSTYYRRRAKARQEAALAQAIAAREAVLDRLASQLVELRANLEKIAVANAAMAAELALAEWKPGR